MQMLPAGEPQDLIYEFGGVGPCGLYEAKALLADPELWVEESSTLDALLRCYMAVAATKERLYVTSKQLTEVHGALHGSMALQAKIAALGESCSDMWPDFMRVLSNRVSSSQWVIPWPGPADSYPAPPAPPSSEDGDSGNRTLRNAGVPHPDARRVDATAYRFAVLQHRVEHSHAALAWRRGGVKSWLAGPLTEQFQDLTYLPSEVLSAQSNLDSARDAMNSNEGTGTIERVSRDYRLRAARAALDEALSRRRRDASRSADVSERNQRMGAMQR